MLLIVFFPGWTSNKRNQDRVKSLGRVKKRSVCVLFCSHAIRFGSYFGSLLISRFSGLASTSDLFAYVGPDSPIVWFFFLMSGLFTLSVLNSSCVAQFLFTVVLIRSWSHGLYFPRMALMIVVPDMRVPSCFPFLYSSRRFFSTCGSDRHGPFPSLLWFLSCPCYVRFCDTCGSCLSGSSLKSLRIDQFALTSLPSWVLFAWSSMRRRKTS